MPELISVNMVLLQAAICKCVSTDRGHVVQLRWNQHSKFVVAANWFERSLRALYSPSRLSYLVRPSSTVRHS